MATFQDSLDLFKDEFVKISDEFKTIKNTETTRKIKLELADLNKHYVNLSDRLVKNDQTSKVEESDFKISLLERKIDALETRLVQIQEEKSMEGAFSNVIKSVYSMQRPASSYPKNLSSSMKLESSQLDSDSIRAPRTAPGKSRAPVLFKTTSRRRSVIG